MSISSWPKNERPREKLLLRGAGALSDAELLAIFLRTGTRGKSALDLARDLLNRFGSLNKLLSCPLTEFTSILGLGPAKYVQLQATVELGQRYLQEALTTTNTLTSARDVKHYLTSKLSHLEHEVFACLLLNSQNHLIRYQVLATGTHNEARVYPREVVKLALHHNASAVILAHNHPSGNSQASEADLQLTRVLQDALGLIDVTIHDHIIVANQQTFSFAEQGWL